MYKTPKLRFKEFSGDWEQKKLHQISDVLSGKRVPKGMNLVGYDTGIPYITVSDMGNKHIDISKLKYITPEIEAYIKKYKVLTNDIIISVAGTLGKINLIQSELENANLTENCDKITNLRNTDYKYLYYYLNTGNIQNQISSVNTISSQPKLALACIRDFDIYIPNLKEQEKIASFFSVIDDKISLQGQKVEDLKDYKKGMMQKIFSRELRFKDDEGRDYPEWEEKKLGEITSLVKDGSHGTHVDVKDGPYLLSAKNIKDGKIIITDNERRISYDEYNKIYNNYKLKEGDILLSIVGTIGRLAIAPKVDNIAFQRSVAILRFNDINEHYIIQFMNTNQFQNELVTRQVISAQPGIYLNDLKKMKIIIPCIEEQKKIADLLGNLDEKINKEQEKLNSLNEYKRGLLQQMFM
ncbi:restriction endonuclease subunit S [Paraclostridium sordellii]|uniref:restriction endonuclease subunit S n=1 Tax=Paraclostridium sordellii TaxID=1505 RepID=UPI000E4A597F|nr:restriction endonuclease subunit S [Paeniclostridium sordellii]RGX07991.1 hypothetical protein DWV40_09210 [Paeniclostridium sordellii]